LTEVRFYVPLDTKYVVLKMFFLASLWHNTEREHGVPSQLQQSAVRKSFWWMLKERMKFC